MNIFNWWKPSQEKGKLLWERLNAELPEAFGILEDDEPRMATFELKVQEMSKKEKASLKLYLEYLLDSYDDSGYIVFASEATYCRRQRQICRTHLQYL